MAQPGMVEHSWLMYSFTAFLNTSLVGNVVQPERVTGAGVTATETVLVPVAPVPEASLPHNLDLLMLLQLSSYQLLP